MSPSPWLKQAIARATEAAKAIPPERRAIILAKYTPGARPPRGYGHNWLFPAD